MKLIKNERGMTTVFMSLIMVTLLGFIGIVIDVGRVYFERQHIQNAYDAAALAGVQELINNNLDISTKKNNAIDKAEEFLVSNKETIDDTDGINDAFDGINAYFKEVNPNSGKTEVSVEVAGTKMVPMTLASLIGISEMEVPVYAKAAAGGITSASGFAPIAVTDESYDAAFTVIPDFSGPDIHNSGGDPRVSNLVPIIFKQDPTNSNYGFIALPECGTGNACVESNLKSGGTASLGSYEGLESEPGNKLNSYPKVEEEIQRRIDNDVADPDKDYCNNPVTATNSCERIIFVPIIDEFPSGRGDVNITGFTAFWIEGVTGHGDDIQLIGHIRKDLAISGRIDMDNLTEDLYGIKLVK